MELLRLEIKGFKSFADKTIVNFSPGMTAIVGPNGSGKSNITDAIRWVLGESNVRHLRGQKAEDIIFSGTETRRAQNAAEVTLVFDNSDHKLGEDYAEVAISRRIYRSGDSEFFINKRACRLKDIHFLLADTGLGKDSMAIIGQNRVDAILNSKPEERRQIFEDVAGIGRFKLNKEEALRKIAQTERNVERLEDVMGTLATHLQELEGKAEVTRTYEGLAQEKRRYDGALAYHEYKTADRLFTKQENEKLQLDGELQELEENRQALAAHVGSQQGNVEALRQQLMALDEATAAHREELGRMEGQLLVWTEKERRLADDVQTLGKQIQSLEHSQALNRSALEELDASKERAREEASRYEEQEQEAKTNYDALVERLKVEEAKLERLLKEDASQEEKRKTIQGEIFRLEHSIASWVDRYERGKEESLELRSQADSLTISEGAMKEELRVAEDTLKTLTDAVTVASSDLSSHQQALKERGEQLHRAERELQVHLGRKEALDAQEQDFVGYAEGTKHVLQCKESWASGIHGAVGDLFEVESRFVKAIEVALGASIHHVVTDTAHTASQGIAYLRRILGGKATFLPLESIRGKTSPMSLLKEDGVLGLAHQCVTFKEDYKSVFEYVLGRTIIVESLSKGIALQKRYNQSLRLVTLEGDQLQPGGALTGGEMKKKGSHLLTRKEEQSRLGRTIEALADTIAGHEMWIEAQQKSVHGLEEAHRERLKACEKARHEWTTKSAQYQSLIAVLQDLEEKLASQEMMLQSWEQELIQAKHALGENESALATLVGGQDRSMMESLQGALKALAVEERRAYDHWRNCTLQWEQQKLHWQHKEESYDTLCQSLEETMRTIEEAQQRRAALLEEGRHLPEEKQQLEMQLKDLQERVERNQGERAAMQDQLRLAELELESTREEQHNISRRVEYIQQRLTGIQENLVKYKINEEYALQRLDELGFTREEGRTIVLDGGVQEWKEKQLSLEQDISALGPVNPQAIVEFEEALERKVFYETQLQDLLGGKTQLLQVVEEVDQVMCAQLEEVYDRVGKEFQYIFSSLFGGGVAHIEVTNREDLLQGGVEFYIQPPGKKRQQLSLLSGGERALTVIALLFAFLAYRPSPVCVLDEVDAALDEANVERFSTYLQQLGKDTQFIVVSHRKRTMEAAHVLQGVTMVERGVSKLLTVTFDDLMEDIEYGL